MQQIKRVLTNSHKFCFHTGNYPSENAAPFIAALISLATNPNANDEEEFIHEGLIVHLLDENCSYDASVWEQAIEAAKMGIDTLDDYLIEHDPDY